MRIKLSFFKKSSIKKPMQLDQCMPNVSERFPDMREEKRKNEKIGIGPCFPLA
jgi:hypothetical protein